MYFIILFGTIYNMCAISLVFLEYSYKLFGVMKDSTAFALLDILRYSEY